ncbi:hypothetical protein CVM73_26395 [Bradyrhizobium forestalis]|uniref:Uncharacterized protein n=1 Tax=Bradyrhizobium forestalis TaxID=1419263 RepID=A0A2M8R381_9BRAD|nr:hypothetical protein CVM73_26395 [Bradyrhizobium forestalis]
MNTLSKRWHGRSVPVIVAVSVAVVGQAFVLIGDFGPGNDSQGNRSAAAMVTAAAVSRAGAIEIPSEPIKRPTV